MPADRRYAERHRFDRQRSRLSQPRYQLGGIANHDEAAVRQLCNDTAVFGTRDQIARKIEALQQDGVEYMLVNFGGSRDNIRRFARDIMPAFAEAPRQAAAK